MVKIYIGPNGYGKTTKLNAEKDRLMLEDDILESNILFFPSELLLLDEMKDTKDGTQTMEYILTELLETDDISDTKTELEELIDAEILYKQSELNDIVDEVLSYNEQERVKDFIQVTPKKEYKKLVKIDVSDIKNKMGSGQRLHVLLGLVKNSRRDYIFIDEPEKYSHPSLLNKTAQLINDLNDNGKNIYIATHSAKLISMLDVEFSDIQVLNDNSYQVKDVIPSNLGDKLASLANVSYNEHIKKFYDLDKLERLLKQYYYRDFIEALFTKKIILCEGVNDIVFVQRVLQKCNLYYDDNMIFRTGGKHLMPIFISIFKELGIDLYVYYDQDDEDNQQHEKSNEFINSSGVSSFKFVPNLESHINCGRIPKDRSLELIEFLEDFEDYDNYNIFGNN